MRISQWLALAILFAILAGLAFLFVRHGAKIKPGHGYETDGNTTQGGSN